MSRTHKNPKTDESDLRVDGVLADSRWEFDDEVTRVFDNMLERSIPQYHTMRAAVDEIALRMANDLAWGAPVIVDIGCSRGGAIARLVEQLPFAHFLGLEISEPMLDAARERFADLPQVLLLQHDLRQGLPSEADNAAVILSILTLQFTPIEYRQQIVSEVYDALAPGGAFILVEKVLGRGRRINDLMVDVYHDTKEAAGYTQQQIERKRLSLEGVLVPQMEATNRWYLTDAGFSNIDCFWRWMNFAGWVAIK